MLSSVQSGINAIPQNINAVIILLGDQPMITSKIIDKLIETYKTSSKGIIIPSHNGKRGHPILIDLKYRQEINILQCLFEARCFGMRNQFDH